MTCAYELALEASFGILFEFPGVMSGSVDDHALADDIVRFVPKLDGEDSVSFHLVWAPVGRVPEPFGTDNGTLGQVVLFLDLCMEVFKAVFKTGREELYDHLIIVSFNLYDSREAVLEGFGHFCLLEPVGSVLRFHFKQNSSVL